MSRNFELLQQVQKEHSEFRTLQPLQEEHSEFRTPASAVTYPCDRQREVDLDETSRGEITRLVQRLFLCLSNGDERRTVLFAGIEAGDGSSLICACGGQTLARQVTGKVCIVDANLRSPSMHKHFGVENSCGLAEAVLQARPIGDLAKPLTRGNLWLVPSGTAPSDLPPVPCSELLRGLGQLRAQFDYVLINAPPLGAYADAAVIGKIADGVVLVVEANSTKRETARQVKASLEAANVRLLGAVLNQRTFPIPETIYRRL